MTLAKVGDGIGTTLSSSITNKRLNSTEMTVRQEQRLAYYGSYFSILVMIYHLSKFDYFIPLTHPFTTKQVAEEFIKRVATIHDMTKSIITYRTSIFFNSFWKKFFNLQGTTFKTSTTNYPETDEQIEVLNHSLGIHLLCYVSDHPKQWTRFLPRTQLWYNTSFFRLPESLSMRLFLEVSLPLYLDMS